MSRDQGYRWRKSARLHCSERPSPNVAVQEIQRVAILERTREQHAARARGREPEPQRRAPAQGLEGLDKRRLAGQLALPDSSEPPSASLDRVERIERDAKFHRIRDRRKEVGEQLHGQRSCGSTCDEPGE